MRNAAPSAGLRGGLRAAAHGPSSLKFFVPSRSGRPTQGDRSANHSPTTPRPLGAATMQNSSEFQYIAIDTIHESATNPRRTFDESQASASLPRIHPHQRPDSTHHRTALTRRASRLSQEPGASVPRSLRSCFLSPPASSISTTHRRSNGSWSRTRNASTFTPTKKHRASSGCWTCPGYDVATLVEKSGKSAAHVYARLSLLQLVPSIAEAFLARAHHGIACQPAGPFAAGCTGQRLRAVLAQGLAGQRAPPATCKALKRVDTNKPLPLPCRGPIRQGRPDAESACRSLRYLPSPQRFQYQPVCRCTGRPMP